MPAVSARTNNFAVTDIDALASALSTHQVTVHRRANGRRVMLTTPDGWTAAVADTVGPLLRPGSVALFMHTDQPAENAYPYIATRTHTIEAAVAAN